MNSGGDVDKHLEHQSLEILYSGFLPYTMMCGDDDCSLFIYIYIDIMDCASGYCLSAHNVPTISMTAG